MKSKKKRGKRRKPEPPDLRSVLDGVVERRLSGFDSHSNANDSRTLYIPYHLTTCPAEARAICRSVGLLRTKLDKMTPDMAAITYLTELAKPLLPS
jgi:hypothetical protein